MFLHSVEFCQVPLSLIKRCLAHVLSSISAMLGWQQLLSYDVLWHSELSWKEQAFLCSSVTVKHLDVVWKEGTYSLTLSCQGTLRHYYLPKKLFNAKKSSWKKRKKEPQIQRFKPGVCEMFGLGFFCMDITELQICRLQVPISVFKKYWFSRLWCWKHVTLYIVLLPKLSCKYSEMIIWGLSSVCVLFMSRPSCLQLMSLWFPFCRKVASGAVGSLTLLDPVGSSSRAGKFL